MIENLSLLAIFAPFIGFLIIISSGRFLGRQGSILIALSGIITTLLSSIFLLYYVALSQAIINIKLFQWLSLGYTNISFGFMFDSLTCIMLFVVSLVSTLVHLYSIDYMSHDPHISRFMSYLSLFSFFMLILVSADNFIQLFLGWEGVGLASYLLINFWFTRIEASKAAIKAIIMNRIGDFGLCLGIIAIFFLCNSLDFAVVFSTIGYFKNSEFTLLNINYITFISLLLFVGAVGKSAQIGLHTWLPDAMEGPTPVSALIHAATMVTAGVFLLIRCSPILEYSETALTIITIIGGITAFFASTIGVFQNDLKKVIAYSTCSQLGYMVLACGLSCYNIAMFHLVTHAFFKALLFLGAGSIIHAVSDEQDMRKMGGLIQLLPFTYICMLIGSLALAGFPFLSGFYSKELILEVALGSYSLKGLFGYILGCLAAFFTAFYSTRLLALVFYIKPNGSAIIYKKAHDAPKFIIISLSLLTIFSIFTGYLTKDILVGLGTDFWTSSIFILQKHQLQIDSEFIPYYLKLIPVLFSFSGMCLGYWLYVNKIDFLFNMKQIKQVQFLIEFFSKKWFFDILYNWFGARVFLNFGYKISFKTLDRGLFELFGTLGISRSLSQLAIKFSHLQSGYIYHYALIIVLGFITFLILEWFAPYAQEIFPLVLVFYIIELFRVN